MPYPPKYIATIGEPFIFDIKEAVFGLWFRPRKGRKKNPLRNRALHMYAYTKFVLQELPRSNIVSKIYVSACGREFLEPGEVVAGNEAQSVVPPVEGVCITCIEANRRRLKAAGFFKRKKESIKKAKATVAAKNKSVLPDGEIPWYDR